MNRSLLLLLSIFIFSSCEEKKSLEGFWEIDYNESFEDSMFPIFLNFSQDTLTIANSHIFKQTASYRKTQECIYIKFENEVEAKYPYAIESYSVIFFSSRRFLRISGDFFTKSNQYNLIGYKSTKEFIPEGNLVVLHLIKENGLAKVILNDQISALEDLPKFFDASEHRFEKIIIYVAQNIQLKDLIEVYCWINHFGYTKVELITANQTFEKFYSIDDSINLNDSIIAEFERNTKNLPPLPKQKIDLNIVKDIYVNSIKELKQLKISDSILYRINISNQIDIMEYLELIEFINNKNNSNLKHCLH
uniref:hypothetical protein n=1 Tax=Flavobacterium sp. TaxID=239 RepID=UPI0040497CF4